MEVAHRATQLEPGARFQSAALLIDALEHVDRPAGPDRSRAQWWWEFHQVTAAAIYGLTLWPAWIARQTIGEHRWSDPFHRDPRGRGSERLSEAAHVVRQPFLHG